MKSKVEEEEEEEGRRNEILEKVKGITKRDGVRKQKVWDEGHLKRGTAW